MHSRPQQEWKRVYHGALLFRPMTLFWSAAWIAGCRKSDVSCLLYDKFIGKKTTLSHIFVRTYLTIGRELREAILAQFSRTSSISIDAGRT